MEGRSGCRAQLWDLLLPGISTVSPNDFLQTLHLLLCVHACMLSHFSHVWLCNPVGSSPPGSSVHGILQARILKWVTMPFSSGSFWPRDQTHVSCVSCIGRWIFYHWCHLRGWWPDMKREDPISNCSLKSESESRSVMSDSLQPHGLYRPGNSPGQNTGAGSFSLLQGYPP